MSKLNSLKHRIYSDYFLPNRLGLYRSILEFALAHGYEIVSVENYYDLKQDNQVLPNKIIICRHDIDTDPSVVEDFFKIEQELGVRASYYFRLSTLSPNLMAAIEDYGSEASYHYEEIASYCKVHRIKNRELIWSAMPEIQSQFIDNYLSIKTKLSLKMRTVCSHGDFVNRYLKIVNTELLTAEIRKECGIQCEAYDQIIRRDSFNISDCCAPIFWKNESPFISIARGEQIINLLTHPRHWRVSWQSNTKDNFQRAVEEINYYYSGYSNNSGNSVPG